MSDYLEHSDSFKTHYFYQIAQSSREAYPVVILMMHPASKPSQGWDTDGL